MSIWETGREYVRYTGPRHIKSESDKVGIVLFHGTISSLVVSYCHCVGWARYPSCCCYLDARHLHARLFRDDEQVATGNAASCS